MGRGWKPPSYFKKSFRLALYMFQIVFDNYGEFVKSYGVGEGCSFGQINVCIREGVLRFGKHINSCQCVLLDRLIGLCWCFAGQNE